VNNIELLEFEGDDGGGKNGKKTSIGINKGLANSGIFCRGGGKTWSLFNKYLRR